MVNKRKRTLLRNVTQILVVVAVFVGIRAYLLQGSLTRGPAPSFAAPLLDGGQFSLSDTRGEPLLIHFWATWCKICALNDGAIDGLAEDMQVITVAMESGGAKDIRKEMDERGLKFPVIVDGLGKLANKYHVKGVPTNYIIDADGNIRYVEVGYTTGIGLRIRMWLASM
ncbi:MAG TPA: protein disulfide oxidoreductase [Gammaproteobacteria bacterium]|nr:protein disulfide oxidoreductase [Gammaproteobacteria bacterium]